MAPAMVIAGLTALYATWMEQLGTIVTRRVQSTKLENRISRYCPALDEHMQGRDVCLAFNQDIGPAWEQAADDDAIHLAKAFIISYQVQPPSEDTQPRPGRCIVRIGYVCLVCSYDRVMSISSSQLTVITRCGITLRNNMQFVPLS